MKFVYADYARKMRILCHGIKSQDRFSYPRVSYPSIIVPVIAFSVLGCSSPAFAASGEYFLNIPQEIVESDTQKRVPLSKILQVSKKRSGVLDKRDQVTTASPKRT